jgi:hypothetical protein
VHYGDFDDVSSSMKNKGKAAMEESEQEEEAEDSNYADE